MCVVMFAVCLGVGCWGDWYCGSGCVLVVVGFWWGAGCFGGGGVSAGAWLGERGRRGPGLSRVRGWGLPWHRVGVALVGGPGPEG